MGRSSNDLLHVYENSSNIECRAYKATHREPMEHDSSAGSRENFPEILPRVEELSKQTQHSDNNKLECNFCAVLYDRCGRKSLSQVKKVTGETLYLCYRCSKSYSHFTSLEEHMKETHQSSCLEGWSNENLLSRWTNLQQYSCTSKESSRFSETQIASNTVNSPPIAYRRKAAIKEGAKKPSGGVEELIPLVCLVPDNDMEIDEEDGNSSSRVSKFKGADDGSQEKVFLELNVEEREIAKGNIVIDLYSEYPEISL